MVGAKRRFVYGPVPSRRLGLSLGVDILPYKTCSLDCVYCQLGPTRRTTVRRRSFVPVEDVLDQVRKALGSGRRIDVVTFSGSGEPTLNRDLGRLIRGVKALTSRPVVVLTNGTLLSRRDVRRDLAAADIVVPSLDAASAGLFRRVNRPHPSLRLGPIVDGLVRLRREFPGQIWLEIMLVKGMNDSAAHIRALRRAVVAIRPDRVQLNTVVRPPAEDSARPLTARRLREIRAALGPTAEIVAPFSGRGRSPTAAGLERAVLEAAGRRPLSVEDFAAAIGRHRDEVLKAVGALLRRGRLRRTRHGGTTFYVRA